MAFQPAPGIVEAEFRMVWDSQRVENVLHFASGQSDDPAAIETLAQDLRVSWQTNMLPLQSNLVTLNSVYVRSLDSAIAPAYESFPANAQSGDVTNPSLPNNVSWTVKFTTGLTGRSGRGRNYVIGLCEAQVTANLLSQAQADAWVDAYNALFATAAADGWQPVVLSRVQAGVRLANAVGYAITGLGYSDRVVDSQRRRLPTRGT